MSRVEEPLRGEKHGGFYARMREHILCGEWPLGSRIPNHVELVRELGTAKMTIQKAINRLKRDGYLVARGRLGTFVSSVFPNKHRFALCFPVLRHSPQMGSLFYRAFETEADSVNLSGEAEVVRYYGLAQESGGDLPKLIDDLSNQAIGGALLVTVSPQFTRGHKALLSLPGKVFQIYDTLAPPKGIIPVWTHPALDQVLGHLLRRNRRRLGLVYPSVLADQPIHWKQALLRCGIEYDPYRVVSASPQASDAVRVATYHMMKQDPDHRPNAIYVTDDNMVTAVGQAMIDAGVSVPNDVEIVTHCNFPLRPSCPVATTLVGYDMGKLLRDLIAQALGRSPKGRSIKKWDISAVFERELPLDRRLAISESGNQLGSPNYKTDVAAGSK